jgi:hypothetical protein
MRKKQLELLKIGGAGRLYSTMRGARNFVIVLGCCNRVVKHEVIQKCAAIDKGLSLKYSLGFPREGWPSG